MTTNFPATGVERAHYLTCLLAADLVAASKVDRLVSLPRLLNLKTQTTGALVVRELLRRLNLKPPPSSVAALVSGAQTLLPPAPLIRKKSGLLEADSSPPHRLSLPAGLAASVDGARWALPAIPLALLMKATGDDHPLPAIAHLVRLNCSVPSLHAESLSLQPIARYLLLLRWVVASWSFCLAQTLPQRLLPCLPLTPLTTLRSPTPSALPSEPNHIVHSSHIH